MAKRLHVSTGIQFDSIEKLQKEAQGILDKVSKKINLKIPTVDISNLDKSIDKINKKINTMYNFNTPIINTSDIKNIENISKELSKLSNLNKYKIELLPDGQVKVITEINNKLKETVKTVQNLSSGNKTISISGDLETQKKNAYLEITKLQKTEYDLKTQLLKADGEYANVLRQQIEYAQQLQSMVKNEIDNSNLKDAEKYNVILKERSILEDKLSSAKAKLETSNLDKLNKDLLKQNDYLDKVISKLKLYQQSVENSGGSRPTDQANLNAELTKQITKLEQLKKSNNLLSSAEKNRINSTTNQLRLQTNELIKYELSFSNLFKKIGNYALGGTLIYGMINEVKEGISNIVDLDTAMRDLTKVAKATQKELDSFVKVANSMAIEVGTSTEAIVKATEYYSKLGYAILEASERAKTATIFSNVSDMNIEDASKALITVQKGFGLETIEDLNRIGDALNEVGNNYSSTSQDIAEGLRKSSSALREANNSFEESIGLFVSANSAIQDSATTGTALKTISLRLKGMETDLGDTVEPISKLRDELIKLADVDIMEADGNTFRSTYDIIVDLSQQWSKLTETQRSWISEQVAGKQQANVFSSLLFNMADGVKAYETALNSSNSMAEEQARYMESIQGKVNEFTETLKGIWVNAISSDAIKTTVDMGTTLLKVLSSISEKFGLIPTTIGLATASVMLFNKEMYLGFTKNIPIVGNLNTKILSASKSIENMIGDKIINLFSKWSDSMTTATAKTATLKAGNVALSASMEAVSVASALATSAMTMGLSVAITAVISGLTKLIDKAITTDKELKEMNATATETITTTSKSVADAEKLLSQKNKLDKEYTNTTDVEKRKELESELLDVQRQLATVLPNSASGFDMEGQAISANNALIEESIRLKKDEMEIASLSFIENNRALAGEIASLDEKKKKYEEMKLALQQGKKYIEKDFTYTDRGQEYTQKIKVKVSSEDLEKLNNEISDTTLKVQQASTHIEFLIENGYDLEEINKMGFSTEAVENYIKSLDESTRSLKENTKAKEDNANVEIGGVSSDVTSIEQATKSYGEAISKVQELDTLLQKINEEQSMTPELVSEMASKYPELGAGITDAVQSQEFLNQKIQEQVKIQEEMYSIMIGDDEAYYSQRLQNANEMQAEFDKLASMFVDVNGQGYDFDVRNFKTLNEAKNALGNSLNSAMATWISNMVGGNAEGYARDLANMNTLAQKKAYLINKMTDQMNVLQNNMNRMMGKLKDNVYEIDSSGNGTTAGAKEHFEKLANEYANLNANLQKVDEYFGVGANFGGYTPSFGAGSSLSGGTGSSSSGSGSSSSSTEKEIEDMETLTDRYMDLENAVKDYQNAIAINKIYQENASTKEKISLMEQEIELYKKQQEAVKNLNNEQKKEAEEIKKYLSNNQYKFDANGNIINANSLLDYRTNRANNELSGEYKGVYIDWVRDKQMGPMVA